MGQAKHGEGIMSLNRAFTYAGVSSSIMSLWQVPDEATRKIMTVFYQGISDGLSKSQALRAAKKSYLKTEIIPQKKHPFYWSGFIFLGDDAPMQLDHPTNYWLFTICGLLLFLVLYLYLKKR